MESTEFFDVLSQVSENAQNYLSVLNEEQFEAAVHEGSPLLILAGAGSGKTRVITTKIAYLIGERQIAPWKILALTFTKKAADEMRHRAINLEEQASQSKILTFHSFGAYFLRTNSKAAGVAENFTVYDDEDSLQLLIRANPRLTKNRASHYARLISLAKDYCLLPDDDLSEICGEDADFPKIYQNYQNRLRETGNVDFGDLILLPYLTLKNDDDVRSYFQNRFRAILVDEYQDTNVAQYLLLQELSGVREGSGNYVCVVGDDDQSIYKFRGAEIQNILTFEKKFPETKIIRLEKNYRSTAEILRVADDVIQNNFGRLGKTLVSQRGHGEKPVLTFFRDADEEALDVVGLIQKDVLLGGKLSSWAVLYRTNAQSLAFENAFMQSKIPYQVVGSLKFFEREEIKDTLSYLSLLANPRDEVAFRRIVNKPPRGIGNTSQEKIATLARSSVLFDTISSIPSMKIDFLAATEKIAPTLSKKASENAKSFVQLFESLKDFLLGEKSSEKSDENEENLPAFDFENENVEEKNDDEHFVWQRTGKLADAIWTVVNESGLLAHYRSFDEDNGTSKVENLIELANSAEPFDLSFDGLVSFLDHIELDRAQNDDGATERVTLITLHNTKGLEFDNVVMTGMENGLFPRDYKNQNEIEEERRLCYVGMTRAKNRLFLTACASRRLYGFTRHSERSIFLDEIDAENLKISSSNGQAWQVRNFLEAQHGKNGLSNSHFESAERFCVGTQIFHDDHGYGEIVKSTTTDSGEKKIFVQFENGEMKTFLPKYASHKLQVVEG